MLWSTNFLILLSFISLSEKSGMRSQEKENQKVVICFVFSMHKMRKNLPLSGELGAAAFCLYLVQLK